MPEVLPVWHRRGAVRQHFGVLGGERGTQRCAPQAGDRALDRQHRWAGDAQHLAAPAVEPTGDSQWIDELDADQTEGLLPMQLRGEECRDAAGAAIAGVVAAPHGRAVGDDRRQCRGDRRAVHLVGRVDANGRRRAAGQGAAQALIGSRAADGDRDDRACGVASP